MSRPVLPWRSPLVALPAPGKDVWIRRLPWYDKPVLAVANATPAFELSVPIHTDPLTYWEPALPPEIIHSWKFRYLADELEAFPPE